MGRGRAKAKQTKVARDLKYRSVDMDLTALERELRAKAEAEAAGIPDQYADLAEKYETSLDDEFEDEYDDDEDDDDENRP